MSGPGVATATAMDQATASAYAFCREVARREAKNFYWSFRVLPRHKRDAMCAVYAFMRQADDLADDESKSIERRRIEMQTWLTAWRDSRVATTGVSVTDPVFLAVADTQHRFGISNELLEQLVAGTTMDLDPHSTGAESVQTYATFDELYGYCYLVASVVGLVTIRIFGYTDPRAEQFAEETGIAFQLTNILRDVKEDVERGRVYIPQDLMDEFGESVDELRTLAAGRQMTLRERGMLATLAIRAEKYYVAAKKLIPLIDQDSRAALWVMVAIYHRLLGQIAARRMNVFGSRVSVSTPVKLSILARGGAMAAWNRVVG